MGDVQTIEVRKCPTCGGAVHYDAAKGSLACTWCGNTYESKDLEVREVNATPAGYVCPECGAQLFMDDFIAATSCPYCGNNEISPHRFDDMFEPDYIIPFSVTKGRAKQAYEELVGQKEYLPAGFTSDSRIISVQGVYVPFWLKDGVVDFDFSFVSDDRGRVGEMVYGDHRRIGTYRYARIPADASSRMPNDMMDSLEPYDLAALEPFTTDCLPGFVAERYTIGPKEVNERIERRAKNSALLACKDDIIDDFWKHSDIDHTRSSAIVHHVRSEQALLPVWLFVTLFKGQKYLVGVNGQTGKVAVNLPIDEERREGEARKSGLISSALMLPVSVLVIALGAIMFPTEVLSNPTYESSGNTSSLFLSVSFLLLGIGSLAFTFVYEHGLTKAKVERSMHNVQEAQHAQDYDIDGLTITTRSTKHGPKVHSNNWPAW